MGTWLKWATELLLVGRDWTIDLDGATISSVEAPVVPAESGLVLTYVETEGNISKYYLSEGRAGALSKVYIAVNTSEGETLVDQVLVRVKQ